MSHPLSCHSRCLKRSFDLMGAVLGVCLTWWIIAIAYLLARFDTKASGFFTQQRIGKDGKIFAIIKIRTMRPAPQLTTTVTTSQDARITRLGRFLRRTKIDELPQLINILLGHMSFVGPRPDVPGFADTLQGEDQIILTIRPGITGPATLKYRREEQLLAQTEDPERLNREVLFPDKVRINREYIEQYSFFQDMKYLYKTLFGEKEQGTRKT
ncbi:sugar transferase [candidate division KSB3 bacterium]|uniref:Sugar transferase n=1 Tax=candidate division KSB3 bacterium TaxID=2044937 RepID=A0A9D5JTA6_9BACT|nr:sugar transferase [candidate division KSB3 bacterium]MBD3323859.1 sugar transferase [candidate division KSB3 bacterium]